MELKPFQKLPRGGLRKHIIATEARAAALESQRDVEFVKMWVVYNILRAYTEVWSGIEQIRRCGLTDGDGRSDEHASEA